MPETENRQRGWFVMRSWEYDRADPTSKYHGADEDTWRDGILAEWTAIAQHTTVDWCQFIFHDKDEVRDENGKVTIKPIHAHAVIRYLNGKTQSAVLKEFCGSNQRSENCQPVDPRKGGFSHAANYLTHRTASADLAEKTWYHHTEVHQFGKRYLDVIKKTGRTRKNIEDLEKTVDEFVTKIMDGEISLKDAKKEFRALEGAPALVRYGLNFERAFAEFRSFKEAEITALAEKGQFRKYTTYIAGPSASGKSTLAKCLGLDRFGAGEVFTSPSGGSSKITADFVDGYAAQSATVFNDISPTEFEPKAFYNMFDKHSIGVMKSRNSNKPWFSTHCYIAVSMPVTEFVIRMQSRDKSDILFANEAIADELIMSFRRIEWLLTYGDCAGQPVVWIGAFREPVPTVQEVVNFAKQQRRNMFDTKIFSAFYDTVGYVPYDPAAHIPTERMRIAKIINAVFDGDLGTPGFFKR